MVSLRGIELLAPARDAKIAIEAINHGADAVYIGAEGFGARVNAGNSVADIAKVVDYAHRFNARVYVTINTIIKDEEVERVERLITQLYRVGVDALIVQDLGILRMNIPHIELHASTQCDIADVEKAEFIDKVGFTQMVLARELSLADIKSIADRVDAAVEVFVHGALCVSYSGRCHASQALKGRSANRGECAQICRLPFELYTAKGDRVTTEGKHLLSLRDMNRLDRIEDLMEAGVSSFKIEGRLKDVNYVKNVVAAYRAEIDKVIERSPDRYVRVSNGVSRVNFTPSLDKSFNRGFTSYFIDSQRNVNGISVASTRTPKSMGELLGRVKRSKDRTLIIESDKTIANGDGISYFNDEGVYTGLRVNRVLNRELNMTQRVAIKPNTAIYRTYDKGFDDALSGETATREVVVDMSLSKTPWGIALTITDELGRSVTAAKGCELEHSRANQSASQASVLSKLGSTIYQVNRMELLAEWFIPASMLTALRRDALLLLERCNRINYKYGVRGVEDMGAKFISKELTFADNVSNAKAKQLYASHGVEHFADAMELTKKGDAKGGNRVLMTTKYCILNELGECRRIANSRFCAADAVPMRLVSGEYISLSVDFDCKNCQMIIKERD